MTENNEEEMELETIIDDPLYGKKNKIDINDKQEIKSFEEILESNEPITTKNEIYNISILRDYYHSKMENREKKLANLEKISEKYKKYEDICCIYNEDRKTVESIIDTINERSSIEEIRKSVENYYIITCKSDWKSLSEKFSEKMYKIGKKNRNHECVLYAILLYSLADLDTFFNYCREIVNNNNSEVLITLTKIFINESLNMNANNSNSLTREPITIDNSNYNIQSKKGFIARILEPLEEFNSKTEDEKKEIKQLIKFKIINNKYFRENSNQMTI